ncbi:hypothetical protein K505DRAFT_17048 [Melanomma pulvis-pyrius CBS 109.77]|uniref:Uncharacterized protein n=1 Tax=Melanomma pulvis-pyrius CBS 109.77 TaxID=1314802 RepID=A0A6A6XUQ8_9PLEO|nr:hypothetical protein K505DRAFT_17048 [Melanomma pulvis-pyrius CBS 109.77]
MCNSVFIFENFQDSKPKTNINCGNSLSNWSYYRNIPASATEAAPSSTPSPSASVTDSNPQPISSTPAAPAQKKKKKKSKGWIAGAVIGPLLGLAIGLIALFLIRRRKKSQQPQPGAAVAGGAPPVQESSEAKPVFAQQGAYAPTTPGYNPHDPYNQQQQQAYGQSPDPQYNTPYNAPGSPPPPQNAYPSDHKYGYNQESTPGFVAELGGGGERAPAPQAAELGDGSVSAPVASGSHAAELSSEPVPKTK